MDGALKILLYAALGVIAIGGILGLISFILSLVAAIKKYRQMKRDL